MLIPALALYMLTPPNDSPYGHRAVLHRELLALRLPPLAVPTAYTSCNSTRLHLQWLRATTAGAQDHYAMHATGHDELVAHNHVGTKNLAPGVGITLFGSLSTLYFMNLTIRFLVVGPCVDRSFYI